MAQLIRQREPESEETALWLNSLAFIPSATKVRARRREDTSLALHLLAMCCVRLVTEG